MWTWLYVDWLFGLTGGDCAWSGVDGGGGGVFLWTDRSASVLSVSQSWSGGCFGRHLAYTGRTRRRLSDARNISLALLLAFLIVFLLSLSLSLQLASSLLLSAGYCCFCSCCFALSSTAGPVLNADDDDVPLTHKFLTFLAFLNFVLTTTTSNMTDGARSCNVLKPQLTNGHRRTDRRA